MGGRRRGGLVFRGMTYGYRSPGSCMWPTDVPLEATDYLLEAWVGDRASATDAAFRFRVTTPEALLVRRERGRPFSMPGLGLLVARATVVVGKLSWDALDEYIGDVVGGTNLATVEEASPVLEQYFVSEWDDYNGGPPSVDSRGRPHVRLVNCLADSGQKLRTLYAVEEDVADYLLHLATIHGASGREQRLVVRVATPKALRRSADGLGAAPVAHHATLVVESFDWRAVGGLLRQLVESCGVESFAQTRWRLRRYFSLAGADSSRG